MSVAADDVTGLFEGMDVPALAEIEVIAKASGEPRISFLRGDAGCDGNLNLTDSIVILNHLFLGGSGFCCETAADVNDDGLTNITDAIFGLNFLFLGGATIPPPFPCGPSPVADVACDVEVCFF